MAASTDLDATVALGVRPPRIDELEQLERKATEVATALDAHIDRLKSVVADEREANLDEARKSLRPGDPAGARAAVERAAEDKTSRFRREQLGPYERLAGDMLAQLDDAAERAALLPKLIPSASAMLTRHALGSAERQRYEQSVATAGPAELRTLALTAIAEDNPILGAAIAGRLSAMRREARPFPGAQLADRLLGEKHARMMAAVTTIVAKRDAARVADRELRTGKRDTAAKIRAGIAQRQLKSDGGREAVGRAMKGRS